MKRISVKRTLALFLVLSLISLLHAQPVVESNSEETIDDAEYPKYSEAVFSALQSFNNGLSKVQEIEETEDNYPYLAIRPDLTKGSLDLGNWGYEEKEYFISGCANTYIVDKEDQLSDVATLPTEPNYTDRVIVYRPEDPDSFSGAVFVEILNASSGADVPNLWRQGYDYLMRNGYIYVGVTSKDSTVNALKNFDSKRYDSLVWPDNGIIWDILGQLGVELKSGESSILYGSKTPSGLYLYGSSQSGWYVNSFASYFSLANFLSPESEGKHIYDGFFSLVGGFMHNPVGGGGMRMFKPVYATDVPFILMVGENDYNPISVRRSSDRENNKYRHYVVAGASHTEVMYDTDPIDSIQMRGGKKASEYQYFGEIEGSRLTASDFNFSVFINAALENLHLWASKGIPAPQGQYSDEIPGILNNSVFVAERDEYGNMASGIRSPQILVPYACYFGSEKGPGNYSLNHGSMICLDDDVISNLYIDFDDYLNKYEKALDEAIANRLILPEDKKTMMDIAYSAPIFHNLGRDGDDISASMTKKTTKELLSQSSFQDYVVKEYLVRGESFVYGVMKDNLIYKRRLTSFPYTNYMKTIVPNSFEGKVIIDIILHGEEEKDITPYLMNGWAYVGITGDVKAAEEKGGIWEIPSGFDNNAEEFGFVWDIISQTVTDILSSPLLEREETITEITLGLDGEEGPLVNTYEYYFSQFDAYGVNKANTFGNTEILSLSSKENGPSEN